MRAIITKKIKEIKVAKNLIKIFHVEEVMENKNNNM